MHDSQAWIARLSELRAAQRPCAVVVVTGVRGSAPREVGARMIVADGALAWGTIGGGNLERLALEHSTRLVEEGGHASETLAFPLSEKVGQCCGGEVSLFFETFPWTRRRLVVFGAGHVGQAVGGLAPYLSAQVTLVDGRDEQRLEPRLPAERPYEVLFVDTPEAELDELPDDSLVLIMTHSHDLDLELVARALGRPFPYLGLIGSERKWARFKKRLEARGFDAGDLARVRCPIGTTRAAKDPRAIALSTVHELSDVLAELEARA